MSTSLDDLLRHEEDPPPRQERPRGRAGVVLRTLLVIAAGTAVVVAGLRAVGLQMSLYVIIVGVAALVAIRRVTARTTPPPPAHRGRRSASGDPDDGSEREQDILARAVDRWETRLVWAQGERDRFNRKVVPAIGALADERLRQRHGVTRESDPDRARELLGDRLWTFLSTPIRRTPPPREFAALVAELEKI